MRPATVDDIEAVACLLLPPASKRAAVDLLRREVVCGLARGLPQQPSWQQCAEAVGVVDHVAAINAWNRWQLWPRERRTAWRVAVNHNLYAMGVDPL